MLPKNNVSFSLLLDPCMITYAPSIAKLAKEYREYGDPAKTDD